MHFKHNLFSIFIFFLKCGKCPGLDPPQVLNFPHFFFWRVPWFILQLLQYKDYPVDDPPLVDAAADSLASVFLQLVPR